MRWLYDISRICYEPKFSTVRTGIGKWSFGIARNVSIGKLEHEPVNLLSLTGQTERLQKKPKSVDKWEVRKVELVDKCMHDSNIKVLSILGSVHLRILFKPDDLPLSQILSDSSLVEALGVQKECGNIRRLGACNKAGIYERLNTLELKHQPKPLKPNQHHPPSSA